MKIVGTTKRSALGEKLMEDFSNHWVNPCIFATLLRNDIMNKTVLYRLHKRSALLPVLNVGTLHVSTLLGCYS
jgi:hypothetical protein